MPRKPEWERLKLIIQPTPRNNHGDNLAHLLYKDIWDKLRREVYARANNRCEICGQTFQTLHCHENWGFNESKKTQFLVSLQSLCADCHNTIHYFRTQHEIRSGRVPLQYLDTMRDHWVRVNNVEREEWLKHVNSKSYVMQMRHNHNYSIDYGKFSVENLTKKYQGLG